MWIHLKVTFFLLSFSLHHAASQIDTGIGELLNASGIGPILDSFQSVVGLRPKSRLYVHLFLYDATHNDTMIDLAQPNIVEPNGKVFILIHGWQEGKDTSPWYPEVTEILLQKNDQAHVIRVDYNETAHDFYPTAAVAVEKIGISVAELIINLVRDGVSLKNITLIGFSLGGQISGVAGRTFFQRTDQKLSRIIALDPAGPLFVNRPANQRINENDAEYVEVIHSNGCVFGTFSPSGTIDFYLNGGCKQPNCVMSISIVCSHFEGWRNFIRALKSPESVLGKKCIYRNLPTKATCNGNEVTMGSLTINATGSYYVDTLTK